MIYKTLTALLLAGCFTLTACGGEKKTKEQILAESAARQEQASAEARAVFSNPAELDKIMAEFMQRPEMQGAEFKVRSISFSTRDYYIELFGRNSKTDTPDTLTSYSYYVQTEKKWRDPQPVKIIGGGKAKDIDASIPLQEVKPDLAMVFAKSDEIIKEVQPDGEIKGLAKIVFYPDTKTYYVTTNSHKTTYKYHEFALNEKGEVIKKDW